MADEDRDTALTEEVAEDIERRKKHDYQRALKKLRQKKGDDYEMNIPGEVSDQIKEREGYTPEKEEKLLLEQQELAEKNTKLMVKKREAQLNALQKFIQQPVGDVETMSEQSPEEQLNELIRFFTKEKQELMDKKLENTTDNN